MYHLIDDQEALDKIKAEFESIRRIYALAMEKYFQENPEALLIFERSK
jgi:hypothetical protein